MLCCCGAVRAAHWLPSLHVYVCLQACPGCSNGCSDPLASTRVNLLLHCTSAGREHGGLLVTVGLHLLGQQQCLHHVTM